MTALNPADPIDLAAIQEVEALAPSLPPILPERDFDEAFKRLEEDDARRQREREYDARQLARRRQDEHTVRCLALGSDYITDPAADQWHSADRKTTLTRGQLDAYMRRWR